MDKRIILAIILVLLILIGIYLFMGSSTPPNLTPSNVVNPNVSGIQVFLS